MPTHQGPQLVAYKYIKSLQRAKGPRFGITRNAYAENELAHQNEWSDLEARHEYSSQMKPLSMKAFGS